ncbi:hypothetical protein MMC30_005915 [Trapelia coarctata]|nr:hypothetical protein [Trapelia coarctata]
MLSGLATSLDTQGFVRHDLVRASVPPSTAESNITNYLALSGGTYAINVTIGTPPQHMMLLLDTGSSDIVILGSNICGSPQALCNPNGNYHVDAGSYNPSLSSTSSFVANNLTMSYADTTKYDGSYYDETFSIAGATVTNVTVGLIQNASAPANLPFIGIIGVGYSNGQSNVVNNEGAPFPMLLEQMKSQGLINTLAYSLYLNDKEADGGEIVFGGIDATKYTGELTQVPVLMNITRPNRFLVSWTSLTFSSRAAGYSLLPSPIPALIDSGNADISLPPDLANAIFSGLGVDPGDYTLPCSTGANDANLTFGFNDDPKALITVPLSALITPVLVNGTAEVDTNGNALCKLGVDTAASDWAVLGEYFMRSAYFVFDLENNVIAMAQANLNATSTSDIKAIGTSGVNATAITTTVEVSLLPTQTAILNTAAAASATAATVSGASLTPTFNLGPSKTGSTASATSSKSAAVGVKAPALDKSILVFGANGLLSLFGGSCLLLV